MGTQLRLRRTRLAFGFVVLTASALLLGCSDDDTPTKPIPSGSWQDIGPSANYASAEHLTTWNGLLVASGQFYHFQGGADASLLTWDGATWSRLDPIGSGINAMAVYDGKLIVGSSPYRQASGDTLPTISAWDGTQWTPFDAGLNRRSVSCLALFEGDLIAGVQQEYNGGAYVSYVARWNGTSWQQMGGTLNGFVGAMTVYQNRLIVAGSFDTAGGASTKSIAAWNGAAWEPLGSGMGGGTNSTGTVIALVADATTLVAGGEFLTAGGIPAVNAARWNGTAWDSLPGLEHPSSYVFVRALEMYQEAPVAGGPFFTDPVRRWSGSTWVPMSTLNGTVECLTIYDGSLIVGGYLPQSANGVARWVPPPPG